MIGEDCTDCNCYSGALNQSCDASGQCYCDTSRLQQTQYSNKKCVGFNTNHLPLEEVAPNVAVVIYLVSLHTKDVNFKAVNILKVH